MAGGNGRITSGDVPVRLPEIPELAATDDVRVVFAEITRTLRVPFLGLFWRVLAADPPVLRLAWEAVRPALSSRAVEAAAADLRRLALIDEVAGIASHKAFKGDLVRAEIDYDLRTRINNFNHVARYALPKHLLAVTLLRQAMHGRTAARGAAADPLPAGPAGGAVAVTPVDPATAPPRVAALLAEIAQAHDLPVAEDYYRSLARLPDYLSAAWNVLRPVVRDEEYGARVRAVAELAVTQAGELPAGAFPAGRLAPAQAGEVARLLELFQSRLLPRTLIDCAIITALTDGPDGKDLDPFAV